MLSGLQKVLQANKAVVSAAGVALTALTFAHAIFSGNPVVGTVFAVATPILTWLIPNATPAGS